MLPTDSAEDPKKIPVARDANLLLYLDLKGLPTFKLTRENMSAQTNQIFRGGVGQMHDISFYLHLFFMKIDLSMRTLFSFFSSAAHAPIKVKVPMDAPDHLYPGSGIMLHWRFDNARFDLAHKQRNTPLANPKVVQKGFLHTKNLTQCEKTNCRFIIPAILAGKAANFQIVIPQKFVHLGFFPQLVLDPYQFAKDMDWGEDQGLKNRVGVFFDISGLPAGEHTIDHWFSLTKGTTIDSCPTPWSIRPL